MRADTRRNLFFVAAPVLLAFLVWGMGGLAPFGHYPGPYGDIMNALAVNERHVTNVVTAVIFDYRGFDTLGEEFILFASVTGVILLLRHQEGASEDECAPHSITEKRVGAVNPQASDLTRLGAMAFIPAILSFGLYTVLTGHLSMGGGFQGGVILSAAWLLTLLAYGSDAFHACANESILEWFEGGGAAIYILVGVVPLFLNHNFLTNVFPLGKTGQLLSSGGIFVINRGVGMEVAAGFLLLLKEFIWPLEREKPLRRP